MLLALAVDVIYQLVQATFRKLNLTKKTNSH